MPPAQLLGLALATALYAGAALLADRALAGHRRARSLVRWILVAAPVVLVLLAMQRFLAGGALLGLRVPGDASRFVDWTKLLLALAAIAATAYEARRARMRRPIAERWKRFVGVALGLASVSAYFGGFPLANKPFGFSAYYHRWDQYHYYMGAKYFRELGYDGLYACAVVAQDELGVVQAGDAQRPVTIDLAQEVRRPEKKIRNLGGDNLLVPATTALEHPPRCRERFAPARWEAFKADVTAFRLASDKGYWDDMQKDHGYNPPPVWTVAGWALASLYPAGQSIALPIVGATLWLQLLAMLDIAYLAATFGALAWGFGWRVAAVGAIFWGTQASAPFFWTGGAFLRQDWLFWLVLAMALTRRGHPRTAGAAIVYSALLRVFPGLVVIGWITIAGAHVWRNRRTPGEVHRPLATGLAGATALAAAAVHFTLHRTAATIAATILVGLASALALRIVAPRMRLAHQKMLVGGIAAACALVPASWAVAGTDAYTKFYEHTILVHDHTPLTNHMGLRVLLSQKPGCVSDTPSAMCTGPESGRMKYVKDPKLLDPFEVWKRMREERWARSRPVAIAIAAASLVLFALALRRSRSAWIAGCLGQIWIILGAQLTCYYYAFMILVAPLTKVRRSLEAPLFGLAALTQLIAMDTPYYDDKYTALTLVSLLFSYAVVATFVRPRDVAALAGRTGARPSPTEPST
jgi:hypothetical protein